MAKHLVCLTFDQDNASGAIARGMTTPTAISRGDFGMVGTERILALLKREQVPTTWFVPGHTIESYPASVAAVVEAGHEIGNHGWTHRVPASLDREEEERELVRANAAIRKLTGRNPSGYRSPAWDLSPHSLELLIRHGFLYDSSLMGHDYLPYQAREYDVVTLEEPIVYGADTKLVEMPISWSLDDFPHFEFLRTDATVLASMQPARAVMQSWLDEFLYMKKSVDWGVLTYTMHPYVIGRGYRMLALEGLLDELTKAGAAFVTMEEAAREARQRLGMT
jgi:peptidoglycan-N-acetylglucosamine deacetylase